MVKALAIAALVWPLLLGAALWQRAAGDRIGWTTIVYLAGSQICHQRPERSFATAGVQWPVCARCSGLYLSAPLGAFAALVSLRRRLRDRPRLLLAIAAVPTALSLVVEWSGLAGVNNLERALAALPLGAAIAFVIIRVARGRPAQSMEYTDPA